MLHRLLLACRAAAHAVMLLQLSRLRVCRSLANLCHQMTCLTKGHSSQCMQGWDLWALAVGQHWGAVQFRTSSRVGPEAVLYGATCWGSPHPAAPQLRLQRLVQGNALGAFVIAHSCTGAALLTQNRQVLLGWVQVRCNSALTNT